MKAIIISAMLFLAAGISIIAQNLIAVQHNGSPAFFTTLQSAVSSAQNGDTIFIPGHIFSIGNIIVNKELHFIGVGHNPDSTLATGFTKLSGGNIYLDTGSSNGSIEGIYLNSGIVFGSVSGWPSIVMGFSISRNNLNSVYFQGDNNMVRYSNNSITENVIRFQIVTNNASNMFIDVQANYIVNNIIMTDLSGLSYDNIIKNNVFAGGGGNSTLSYLNGCIFENNVIIGSQMYQNISNSTFKNNLSPGNICTSFNLSTSNVCYNNISESIENIFINYPSITSTFSYAFDFHLKPASLGNNAGRDGTDVGIYGGLSPWKEGSVPFNPHFQNVLVGPTTNISGNLPVNIKVSAQDH